MWEIWANSLLPKALKSCPKFIKIAQYGHTGWVICSNSPYNVAKCSFVLSKVHAVLKGAA